MITVVIDDDDTDQSIVLNPRHATMRKVPNEDYCFSVRLYGINSFEINRLMKMAKKINDGK